MKYLYNANDSATIIGEVAYASDHIRSVKEGHSVGRQQHEQAHGRNGRPGDQSDDGGPHEEKPQEALDRSRQVDHPWPSTAAVIRYCGGVKKAGENAEVATDILEDRDDVERRLVVALA